MVIVAVASICLSTSTVQGQVLESSEMIHQYDLEWLQSNGYPDAQSAIVVHKLRYWTRALDGSTVIASAAMITPLWDCRSSLVCFVHGSVYLKEDVPSRWENGAGYQTEGFTLGAMGFACVMPDLIGLGDSPGLHPYLHASTGASACIDAVRAAREFVAGVNEGLNDQLFLLGVSAGAHTVMAANQAMQEDHPNEFNVTATGVTSGPYVMYPLFSELMTRDYPYDGVSVVPYVLLGYDQAYPDLFNSTSDFLAWPYSNTIPPLFDGTHNPQTINGELPNIPANVLPNSLRNSLDQHENDPLNLRLKENNVFNWVPQNPVKLCYCGGDSSVDPENSIMAYDTLLANGAPDVTLLEVSTTAGHGACGGIARPIIEAWFDSLRGPCEPFVAGIDQEDAAASRPMVFPNPTSSGNVSILLNGVASGSLVDLTMYDGQGRALHSEQFTTSIGTPHVLTFDKNEAPGIYWLHLQVGDRHFNERMVLLP